MSKQETKFTAGKWRAIEKKNAFIIENDEETYIADVHFWSEGAASVTKANAHLIASAPTLYDTLQVALITIDHAAHQAGSRGEYSVQTEYLKCANIIGEALKKARGE